MLLKKMITKIDHYICKYLGLDRDESKPKNLRWTNHRLVVTHTSSFKRHTMKSSWEEYHSLPNATPNALGFTLGKSIAQQLVISFHEPIIKMNTHEHG